MAFFRRTPSSEQLAAKAEKDRLKEERRAEKQRRWEAQEAAKRLIEERLGKAAGISSVDLVCHPDTWKFIDSETRFMIPIGPPPPKATLIRVPLSGPNLVRIMTSMRFRRDAPGSYVGDRAIAGRVYDAIAEIVDSVNPAAKDGTPVPDIVIDDRVGTMSVVDDED